MRFMVIVKATRNSEAGALPTKELLAEMGAFNEELSKAGVMLAGEGLQPSSKGARIKFSGDKQPTAEELDKMHHAAHDNCFIANSVKTEVTVAK